jgi:hypothetical protein
MQTFPIESTLLKYKRKLILLELKIHFTEIM